MDSGTVAQIQEAIQHPHGHANPKSELNPVRGNTQRAAILRLLIDARGGWVPLPEIMACAAQYNARIFELRRLGFAIENRTEIVGEKQHSWFRLLNSTGPSALEPPKVKSSKPELSWQDRSRATGLLFDLTVRP